MLNSLKQLLPKHLLSKPIWVLFIVVALLFGYQGSQYLYQATTGTYILAQFNHQPYLRQDQQHDAALLAEQFAGKVAVNAVLEVPALKKRLEEDAYVGWLESQLLAYDYPELFKDGKIYPNKALKNKAVRQVLLERYRKAGLLKVTDKEMHRQFTQYLRKYKKNDEVRLQRIVLPDDMPKGEVAKLLKAAQQSDAGFNKVAVSYSQLKNATAVDVWRPLDSYYLPVQQAILKHRLELGVLPVVVQLPDQQLIIKVLGYRPASITTFVSVQNQLRQELMAEKAAHIYEEWFLGAMARTKDKGLLEIMEPVNAESTHFYQQLLDEIKQNESKIK